MSGRKRHILVATLSLLLRVLVHPAHVIDRDGEREFLEPFQGRCPCLVKL